MKQDRFLIFILVGIGLLIAAAFGLFFMRQSQVNYVADDNPAGVVQNYVLALHKGDYEKAYSYLASNVNKPGLEDFSKPFMLKTNDIRSQDVQIRETSLVNDFATVTVVFSEFQDSAYRAYSNNQQALLKLENGKWKITSMPYPYWDYEWYHTPYPQNPAPTTTPPLTPTPVK